MASSSSSSSSLEELHYAVDGIRPKSKSILSSSTQEKRSEIIRKTELLEGSMVKRLTLPTTDDKEPPVVTKDKIRKTLTDEMQSESSFVEWSTSQYEYEARKILENVIADFIDSDENDEPVIFEDIKPENSSVCKGIVTIEPSQGYLEPYEYILVTVGFFPPPNTKVKCVATCRVDEGESENLLITGLSSSISYKLSQDVIEFGRQLFCEVCEKSFTLTNTGYADFHFKTIDQDGSADDSTVAAGWSNVTPAKGFLSSSKSATIAVKYFPGVTGEFKKDILFEIEYLEPITVHLHGYAIFSQLALSLPRPSLKEISPVMTYPAIASITKKYLLQLNDINSKNFPRYVAGHGRPDDINEVTYEELIDDDWAVLSEKDLYPSVMQIDLSIERALVNEHILNKDEILQRHTVARKTDLIPEFTVPPYTLDFGYVIVDKPVCYTVLMLNCGSVCVTVKLVESKKNTLEANGFKIEYQNKKLEVGEMAELLLIFNPTQEKFGIDDKYVEERFKLKLSHGGLVPVAITATVTRPKINVKYACIDFGIVKSGTVLRKSIVIENDGFLLSKWNVEVKSLSKKIKNAYWVLPERGELEPGKKDLLNIYFTPITKAFHNSQITIMVEGNGIPIKFELCGHGTEATLVFSEKKLNFKNSLPYSQNNDKSFLVQNVSTFPIEFCFPDLDQDYDDEKCYAELYLDTYKLRTVLVPERQLGSRLPDIFNSNYISLLDQLRQATIKSPSDQETGRDSILDPMSQYTQDEIFLQLRGYLKSTNFENDDTRTDVYVVEDNSKSRMAIIEAEKPINAEQSQPRNGVFIIFHGADNTGYYKAANRAGRALCLKVYSIDGLIYDELVTNESQPAKEINNIIDAKLMNNKIEMVALPGEDEYDVLLRRIKTMSTASPNRQKSKAGVGKSPRSDKGSDKKNAGNKNTAKDSAASITTDLIWALLKTKFESVKEGIIIESLNSSFLVKTDVALDCLLRAIGCAKYIQVVILSYTLENYMRSEELRLADEKPIKDTGSRKQSTKGTETGSAKSKTSINKSKQILKNLPKDVKVRFEEFGVFLNDTVNKCQSWEKKSQSPLKPPLSKLSATQKGDTRSSTKDSAKDSTSTKKGKSISISNIKTCAGDSIGIPLWIFTNCQDDRYIDSEMLSCMLKNTPELNDAIQDLKRGLVIDVVESSSSFSVIKRSKRKKNMQSEKFRICNGTIEMVKSDCQMSYNAANSKKRGSKRRFSGDRKSDRVSVNSAIKDPIPITFQSRTILQPGDILKYQVSFSPTSCGKFSNIYALTILGNDSTHLIHCNALCQLPTIDFTPEIVFPKCRDSYSEKMLGDRFTFFKNENVFDFGSIIVGKYPYKTNFNLRNSSDLQCSTTIELNENSLFSVEPKNLLIEPNESLSITVSLKAPKKGSISGDMYISIQNNPSVKTIKLLANCCPLEIHVSPKLISFDKVPMAYHMKKTISLRNSSPVDLSWKLAKADWVQDIYKLGKTSGEIKLYSVEEIVVGYSPTKEETNPKKSMEIQILDLHQSESMPIHTESIFLQSDSLEYIIEYENHIDLGDRKGKTNYKIPFHLMNKGKCNVNIVFSLLDNILPNDMHLIRKFFKLNSTSETLQSQKTTTVIFHFNPTTEMNFSNVPVFSCSFVEVDKPENVIRSFIVTFSGVVHLSKFTMCPTTDMYFGYQQIFSSKSQQLEMTNTGKFAFEYKILQLTDIAGEQLQEKTIKKKGKTASDSSKKTSSKKSDVGSGRSKDKSKEKKILNVVKLDVPGFCLSSSAGIVEPNEKVQINVECNPQKKIPYQEVVVILVSEPLKEDVNGRKLTLHVEGSEPNLNFTEYQKMFKEHFIVEKLEQFKLPENIGAHCIFVISESTLHFKNVCVSEMYQTKVYLQNLGQVIANVSTKITDTKNYFSVSPNSLSILPYTSEWIIISFKPDSINIFESKLEISYNAGTDNTFSLTVIGESCVPQIKLLKPKVDETNHVSLSFDPTYLDLNDSQEIEVQNVGPIPCKVIMDLYDNDREMFCLRPRGDTVNLLNLHGYVGSDDIIHSSMVNLLPSQKANFSLVFCAKLAFTVNIKLKIHTVNNPFEVINVSNRMNRSEQMQGSVESIFLIMLQLKFL